MLLALKRFVCKALGVDYVVRHIDATHRQTQQGLLALGNGLVAARLPDGAATATPEYRRMAEVIELLRPCRVEGVGFVRVGGDNDGGYVMLDTLRPPHVTAAYSFGVGDSVAWDRAIADRGIDVFLYDHTVLKLPETHPRFHFVRQGLTGHAALPRCTTLAQAIAANGHAARRDLVLKMDIEDAEWDVLAETSEETLRQFHQIVVELHGLARVLDPAHRGPIVAALQKLARTHQSVHVHGNCARLPIWFDDLVLPQLLEVTYVRRDDYAGRFRERDETFPTEIDQPNLAGWPDIHLGRFGRRSSSSIATVTPESTPRE